jgi:hypothetical protein
VPLARNFREVLLGDSNPQYFLPTRRGRASSEALALFWMKRRVMKRIENEEVIRQVERQTLTYPILHGARVPLPQMEDELFDLRTGAAF